MGTNTASHTVFSGSFGKSQRPTPLPKPFNVFLAGNPNSGKTSLFNKLTGLRYKVANYPGVTVEQKEGKLAALPDSLNAKLIDLPGIYSLSTSALDEAVATEALLGTFEHTPKPDLVISVVNVCNLERGLFLTSQLIDAGFPIIVALNMMDEANQHGIRIKTEILSKRLGGIAVIPISARKSIGIELLIETIRLRLGANTSSSPTKYPWVSSESDKSKLFIESAKKAASQCCSRDSKNATPDSLTLLGMQLLSGSITCSHEHHELELNSLREELRLKDIDPASFEANQRYIWINRVVQDSISIPNNSRQAYLQDKVDLFLTHKVWGLPVFILTMFCLFQSVFYLAQIPVDWLDGCFVQLGEIASRALPPGKFNSLISDGVIAGVGSVVVFVPQIVILFFLLGLLEESGYLTRASFLMDRAFRKFGLQGRAFVPLLSSFACAIPGIMATRTINSHSDRMTTILIAPLMSCSARLPVYTVLISAFIPAHFLVLGFFSLQGLVLFGLYFGGILIAAAMAKLLKGTIFKGLPTSFIMEFPPYRRPSISNIFREVKDRAIIFLRNAGTVILACSVVLWFLASFPGSSLEDSYAGKIGKLIEPTIKPLGFNWELGVAIIASFAAREVFVSSLSTIYNIADSNEAVATKSLVQLLKDKAAVGTFSVATALSLLVFYMLACQCMSTLAICKRETGGWRWPAFMFFYMTALAYVLSLLTYNLASFWL